MPGYPGGGVGTPGRTSGYAPPVLHQRNLALAGTTLDAVGAIVGGCAVHLHETATDLRVATVTSDATTGAYSFAWSDPNTTYYCVAYKAGATIYFGTTVNTLVAI